MRGLVTCIVIFCLSLAAGAPTDEESKTYFKSYNIDKGEVINPIAPFSKDEMVYAVCEGSGADKKCKVFVESTDPDKKPVQSCDLNLKYNFSAVDLGLFNAGNSRAIFAVRDGEAKIKLINVNLKDCQINEVDIDVPKESFILYEFYALILIVPRDKTYDVFLKNKQLCNDFLCKATYDYEGKLVKAAASFPVKDLHLATHQIQYANNAYLVVQLNYKTTNVSLMKDGDDQPITLFTAAKLRGFFRGLSTEENRLGFCIYLDQNGVCQQFDAEGKTKKIQIEFPIYYEGNSFYYFDVLNLENGLLVLWVEKGKPIVITHFDEQGKQGKSVRVDPKCNNNHVVSTQMYKNTNGQYCVNSICMTTIDSRDRSKFSRTTRCFLNNELF